MISSINGRRGEGSASVVGIVAIIVIVIIAGYFLFFRGGASDGGGNDSVDVNLPDTVNVNPPSGGGSAPAPSY